MRRARHLFVAISLIALFIFTASSLSGCAVGELKKTQQELTKTKDDNDVMKTRIKSLEEETTKLREENDKVREENAALKRRMTDAGIAETTEEGNFDICKENLKKIATAVRLYGADNKGIYPKKLSKVFPNPKYLELIPTCPSVSKDTYTDGYVVTTDRKSFTVYCMGKNHSNVKVKGNFPQFSSTQGLVVEKEEEKKKDDE